MDTAYLGQGSDVVLGQDFLTWLWYKSETAGNDAFQTKEGRHFTARMEQRVCVQGGEGESLDTATVSGPMSELREARLGLATGKKVTRALVRFERESETWQATLKAEDFALSGLKTPTMEKSGGKDEDPDALVLEKMYLLEACTEMLDILYRKFLEIRLSPGWDAEVLNVRGWILHESA